MTERAGASDPLDQLYAAPLAEFVAVRKQLATALKKGGDRAGSAAIGALVKPTASAWVVNQVSRRAPQELQKFLVASDTLAKAQLRAGASEADRRRFQDLGTEHRHLLDELLDVARRVVISDGGTRSPSLLDRVADNLRRAPLAEKTRAQLLAGRLVTDIESPGFSALIGLGTPAEVAPRPAAAPPATKSSQKKTSARSEEPNAAAEARRLEQARLVALRTELREKKLALDRARKTLEMQRQAVTRARTHIELMEAELAKARRDFAETEKHEAESRRTLEKAEAEEQALRHTIEEATATA